MHRFGNVQQISIGKLQEELMIKHALSGCIAACLQQPRQQAPKQVTAGCKSDPFLSCGRRDLVAGK